MENNYLFECNSFEEAYKILCNKLIRPQELKIDFSNNRIVIQPNYRYCLPVFDITSVGFVGDFYEFEGKICLKGRYKYNKIPFIVVAIILVEFIIGIGINFFLGKNVILFALAIIFLSCIFAIAFYFTYKFDLENLKNCMKGLEDCLLK